MRLTQSEVLPFLTERLGPHTARAGFLRQHLAGD